MPVDVFVFLVIHGNSWDCTQHEKLSTPHTSAQEQVLQIVFYNFFLLLICKLHSQGNRWGQLGCCRYSLMYMDLSQYPIEAEGCLPVSRSR